MAHSVSIAVATTLFRYAHDYHYQKATTISNFFAPIVELLSYMYIHSIHKALNVDRVPPLTLTLAANKNKK